MTQADLLNALRDCYDPQTRRNLLELNVVRSATLTPDADAPGAGVPGVPPRFRAYIVLTARTLDEAANAQLCAQVENRLAGLPTLSKIEVKLQPPLLPILGPAPGGA